MKFYTPLINKAMEIAYKAHLGQVDKAGAPYIFHPMHLAERVDTEYEICVALLHDVVEDTDITLNDLAAAGFPTEIVRAVDYLTRRKGMSYDDYLARVQKDTIATRVKIEDLKHNLDLTRFARITEKNEEKAKFYKQYLDILLSAEKNYKGEDR